MKEILFADKTLGMIHNGKWLEEMEIRWFGLVWFVGFYGISTFVGYLTPNPFLCK